MTTQRLEERMTIQTKAMVDKVRDMVEKTKAMADHVRVVMEE